MIRPQNLPLPFLLPEELENLQKEKDVELAARIGQSLLQRNTELESRNEFLEEAVSKANEAVQQLRHDLEAKSRLLCLYAEADAIDSPSASTAPAQASPSKLAAVEARLTVVEEERRRASVEAASVKEAAAAADEAHALRLADALQRLTAAETESSGLRKELAERSSEAAVLTAQLTRLNGDLRAAKAESGSLDAERANLLAALARAEQRQEDLEEEFGEYKSRYVELLAVLSEAQEELSFYRRSAPAHGTQADSLYESLASELEASDSGFHSTPAPSARRPPPNDVSGRMESVREVLENLRSLSPSPPVSPLKSAPTTTTMAVAVAQAESSSIPDDPIRPPMEEAASISASRSELRAPSSRLAPPKSPSLQPLRSPEPPPVVPSPTSTASTLPTPSTTIAKETLSRAPRGPESPASLSPTASPPKVHSRVRSLIQGLGSTGLSRAASTDSLASYVGPRLGEPGVPGTRDLEAAIRREKIKELVNRDFQAFRLDQGLPPAPFYFPHAQVVPSPGPGPSSLARSTPDGLRKCIQVGRGSSRFLTRLTSLSEPGSLEASTASVRKTPGILGRAASSGQPSALLSPIKESPRPGRKETNGEGLSAGLLHSPAQETSTGVFSRVCLTSAAASTSAPFAEVAGYRSDESVD